MAKGFLSGIVWGGIVSVLVLVVASKFGGMLDLKFPEPEAAAVAVPAGSEFNQERPDDAPVLPSTEGRPGSTTTPVVSTPEPATPDLPDTTPAATPEAGAVPEAGLDAPDVGDAPEIALGSDVGVTPETVTPQTDTPVIDMAPVAEPSAQAPETGDAPQAVQSPVAEVDAPPVSLPEAPEGLRLPVPQIDDMAPGVTTDRLPRIGAEAETPVVNLEPALIRNAIPFENPANKAMISVILVDVGDVRPDPATLADFPLPLTVAIDPTKPDAKALMAAYRAAGTEIVILTPLPEGASPADVEVSFQSFFRTLPEAVAVLDIPEAVLQESRPRAAQVVEILSETGHGMITYNKGLNSGLQIAAAAGVPAATVFRTIDSGKQDAAVTKRFLDQAAFRSKQDGAVFLVAEARPETISAIAEWALGTRAAAVALAPVSAALKK